VRDFSSAIQVSLELGPRHNQTRAPIGEYAVGHLEGVQRLLGIRPTWLAHLDNPPVPVRQRVVTTEWVYDSRRTVFHSRKSPFCASLNRALNGRG